MIQRRVEDALKVWLENCNQPSVGGLYLFRIREGGGGLLEIRTGHDDPLEPQEDGYVICRCLDDATQRFNQAINLWKVLATVELRYPSMAHETDPRNIPSFDWVCDELSRALLRTDLVQRLNDVADGVSFRSAFWGEPGMQTGIDNFRRAEWALPLYVTVTERKPELALA